MEIMPQSLCFLATVWVEGWKNIGVVITVWTNDLLYQSFDQEVQA